MPTSTVVILVTVEHDAPLAEGEPEIEAVRDVVRAIAESARHRLVARGVRVGRIDADIRQPPTTP